MSIFNTFDFSFFKCFFKHLSEIPKGREGPTVVSIPVGESVKNVNVHF